MADEDTDIVQPEKPSVVPQAVPEENKEQQNPTPETKQMDFAESTLKNAEGIFFNPAIGVNTPDPFVSQDTTQTQSPPAQVDTQSTVAGSDSSGDE